MAAKLIEGTYRVVSASTGRPVGRAYKTLAAAESMAHHKSMTTGNRHVVARVKRASTNGIPKNYIAVGPSEPGVWHVYLTLNDHHEGGVVFRGPGAAAKARAIARQLKQEHPQAAIRVIEN